MDEEFNPEIFTHNKWVILKEIAEAPQSPSDLATKTGTSLSNIIQQLKLLEAYKIVRKGKSDEKNAGKPKTIYHLNIEMAYATILMDGKAEHKVYGINESNKMFFNILSVMTPEDVVYMLKFSFKYEDILKKCKAMGFLRSTKDSIELFLITEHIDEIRSKFSNIFVDDHQGKTKKRVNWSHHEFEITDGLTRKDKYFMDMTKNVQIIKDSDNTLLNFKRKREEM